MVSSETLLAQSDGQLFQGEPVVLAQSAETILPQLPNEDPNEVKVDLARMSRIKVDLVRARRKQSEAAENIAALQRKKAGLPENAQGLKEGMELDTKINKSKADYRYWQQEELRHEAELNLRRQEFYDKYHIRLGP